MTTVSMVEALVCYNSSRNLFRACLVPGDHCTNHFSYDFSGNLQLSSAGCNSLSSVKCILCDQRVGVCLVMTENGSIIKIPRWFSCVIMSCLSFNEGVLGVVSL